MFLESKTEDVDPATVSGGNACAEDLSPPRTPERRMLFGWQDLAYDLGWEDSHLSTPTAPRRQNQRPTGFADAIDGVARDFGWRDHDGEDGRAFPYPNVSRNAADVFASSFVDGSENERANASPSLNIPASESECFHCNYKALDNHQRVCRKNPSNSYHCCFCAKVFVTEFDARGAELRCGSSLRDQHEQCCKKNPDNRQACRHCKRDFFSEWRGNERIKDGPSRCTEHEKVCRQNSANRFQCAHCGEVFVHEFDCKGNRYVNGEAKLEKHAVRCAEMRNSLRKNRPKPASWEDVKRQAEGGPSSQKAESGANAQKSTSDKPASRKAEANGARARRTSAFFSSSSSTQDGAPKKPAPGRAESNCAGAKPRRTSSGLPRGFFREKRQGSQFRFPFAGKDFKEHSQRPTASAATGSKKSQRTFEFVPQTRQRVRPLSAVDQVRHEITSCPPTELKTTLRKLQLAWHPDKNPGREDEAREVFLFVQTTWSSNFR
jgi:hypothetical protein